MVNVVNILFSWPVIGAVVAIFIGIGGVAMSIGSFLLAKICFSVAAILFLTKFGVWISSESYELKWRVLIAFIIFGAIGVGWVFSWQWVNIVEKDMREKEAKKAYVGQLKSEKKVIFSPKENIYPEVEIGDSTSGFMFASPKGEPLFRIAEDIKIEIGKGELKLSTKIRNKNGHIIAEIVNNEWKISPPETGIIWDRNYSKDAVEVRDPNGDIVLQVRLVGHKIQFQARLYDKDGNKIDFVSIGPKKGCIIGANLQNLKIRPIFRYPSELHLGEFVENH